MMDVLAEFATAAEHRYDNARYFVDCMTQEKTSELTDLGGKQAYL